MATRTQHTPTPWYLRCGGGVAWVDYSPRGFPVLQAVKIDGENDCANAEFAVRACNAHDDFVAALKKAERLLPLACQCPDHEDEGECEACSALHEVKAALAKASPVIATIYDELDTMPENPPDA